MSWKAELRSQVSRASWVALLALVALFACPTAFEHAVAQTPSESACRLVVRNTTEHEAVIYVDGRRVSAIGPRGTAWVLCEPGEAWLYARASCHGVEWGPTERRLGPSYTWELTP